MQCIVTHATGMHFLLSKISSDIYFFKFWLPILQTLYFREGGCEDPWSRKHWSTLSKQLNYSPRKFVILVDRYPVSGYGCHKQTFR